MLPPSSLIPDTIPPVPCSAGGLGAALQERLYVVHDTPITDNVLFVSAVSFIVELLGESV